MKRFFLDRDESSHWFMIPVENRAEWDAWTALGADPDDEAGWDIPAYAWPLAGHPNRMTFCSPEEE